MARLALAAGLVLAGLTAPAVAGEVADSAESIRPLLIGSAVPAVTLRTAAGEPVELSAAIGDKPALLLFYRGGW